MLIFIGGNNMSVYKDKDRGTWYVKYTVKDLPTGTKKRKTKRGFKTAKAAKEWERKANCQIDGRETKVIEELAADWENTNQPSKETIRHYNEHIRYRFYNLKGKRVDDISKLDLLAWRNMLNSSEFSTKTKNDTITFLNGVLTFASLVYDIPNNSVVLKRFKKTDDEVMKEMDIWSPEEFNKFISAVDNPMFKAYFKFLFWTGCRRGEGIALQKSDVKGLNVYISHSQRTIKEGLKPTKTKQKRWITMDETLAKIINDLADANTNCNYIFHTEDFKPLCPTSIDYVFKQGIKKSGVKKIRIHDLRHSHASWLIGNGMNMVAVSKRLGHASVEQTLQTYTHLIPDADEAMMAFLNKKQ